MQQQHHRQSLKSGAACKQAMQRSREQIHDPLEHKSIAEPHSSLQTLHQNASHSAAIKSAGQAEPVNAARSSQHRSQQSAGQGPQVAAAASFAAPLLDLGESSPEPLSLAPCDAADNREPVRASLPQRPHIEGSEQCSTTSRHSTAQSGMQAAGTLPADQHQRAAAPDKSVPQRQAPLRRRLQDWDLPPEVVKVRLLLPNPAYQPNPLLHHCCRLHNPQPRLPFSTRTSTCRRSCRITGTLPILDPNTVPVFADLNEQSHPCSFCRHTGQIPTLSLCLHLDEQSHPFSICRHMGPMALSRCTHGRRRPWSAARPATTWSTPHPPPAAKPWLRSCSW